MLIRASFLQPSRAINGCPCVPRRLFPFQLLYLLMFSVECLPLSPTAGGLCPSPPKQHQASLPLGGPDAGPGADAEEVLQVWVQCDGWRKLDFSPFSEAEETPPRCVFLLFLVTVSHASCPQTEWGGGPPLLGVSVDWRAGSSPRPRPPRPCCQRRGGRRCGTSSRGHASPQPERRHALGRGQTLRLPGPRDWPGSASGEESGRPRSLAVTAALGPMVLGDLPFTPRSWPLGWQGAASLGRPCQCLSLRCHVRFCPAPLLQPIKVPRGPRGALGAHAGRRVLKCNSHDAHFGFSILSCVTREHPNQGSCRCEASLSLRVAPRLHGGGTCFINCSYEFGFSKFHSTLLTSTLPGGCIGFP